MMAATKATRLLVVTVAVLAANFLICQGEEYPLEYQPEMDDIDVDEYLKNDILMERQIQCILHDGPCDEVGRWLKARIPGAVMGKCNLCTPKQEVTLPKIVSHIQEHRPQEYRQGMAKYVLQAAYKWLG